MTPPEQCEKVPVEASGSGPALAAGVTPNADSVSLNVKVWWIPQVPMKAFEFAVPDIKTGALLVDALAQYDLFQYENKVKPDYANAGGVSVLDVDGWCDVDLDDPEDVAWAESVLIQQSGRSAS